MAPGSLFDSPFQPPRKGVVSNPEPSTLPTIVICKNWPGVRSDIGRAPGSNSTHSAFSPMTDEPTEDTSATSSAPTEARAFTTTDLPCTPAICALLGDAMPPGVDTLVVIHTKLRGWGG